MSIVAFVADLTAPVNAVLVVGLWVYVRERFRAVSDRVKRLEGAYIPDGGVEE